VPTRAPLRPLLLVFDEAPEHGVGQAPFQAEQSALLARDDANVL